jgi:DNA-binding MarR family transcriptional regulator
MKSELSDFLPYLLNQAAEHVSRDFQPYYRDRYGMLRTEWRVLFHLGRRGEMTAKQICDVAALHKTKVSRAVTALEAKRFLVRRESTSDRRFEVLSLTRTGVSAFESLALAATRYERSLEQVLGQDDTAVLKNILKRLISQVQSNSR